MAVIRPLATGRLSELGQRARDSSAHRLFAKLALVLIPAFVLPASVGLWWLASIDIATEHNSLTSRIGNATARVASAVARQLEQNAESEASHTTVQELLGTLLSDQAVLCVELVRGAEGEPLALVPARIGCLGQAIDVDIEVPLPGRTSDRLIVHLSTDEIRAAQRYRRELSLVMLLGGLALALLASWVGFQLIVGRPLEILLRAIRRSELSGAAGLARNSSNDELGHISRSFNDMQLRMQRDADRLEQALGDLDRIYNTTPGLLCATDERGTITSVSDHWLASTGFDRADVLGRPLADYFASRHLQTFEYQVCGRLANNGRVADFPLQLRRNNGADFDILLSAVVYRDPTRDKISHLYAMTDIGELRTVERRLEHLARTDPLCELPNRRGFIEHLRTSKDRARHRPMLAAVLFIDLDNFKWINDTYGHAIGDKLLVAAAGRLRSGIRSGDTLARMGGDEFAIVCHGLKEQRTAVGLAEKLIERLSAPFDLDGVSALIGASIGIAFTDWQSQEPEEILRHADLAMYKAKQQGKSTQVVYEASIGERAIEVTQVRDVIHLGLEHDWFCLNYQPIVDANSGEIAGIEVLLRLDSPTLGRLGPHRFIPIAEQSGQIVELGNLALRRGLADLDPVLKNQTHSELYVAVNLSPRQLDDRFEETLAVILDDRPELVGRLVLEITETTLLQRQEEVAARLHRLRQLGARIALDDFGTGYSSLGHIQQFPVDIVKIDKSFIGQLATRPDGGNCPTAMVRAISLLGRELGIEVVAEGVEDPETVELLLHAEITLLQGYHYARPMDRPALDAWLAATRVRPGGRRAVLDRVAS